MHNNSRVSEVSVESALLTDLPALLEIEQICFNHDRLSRRSFSRWLKAKNCVFLLLREGEQVLGYGLVLLHKGTRLARLYSLALLPTARGRGLAQKLLEALEVASADRGRLFMRLEVAKHNQPAIALYQQLGYRVFGEYSNYYEDADDALRMQKRIRHVSQKNHVFMAPWYQQTTDFTCGPASLMMAMAGLDPNIQPTRSLELDLWREATTIFMTSGHGGCHPLGLALAAERRGFSTLCYLNSSEPLFVNGVRSEHKKALIIDVDADFNDKAKAQGVEVNYQVLTKVELMRLMAAGYVALVLISTYRMDGKKTPHWVLVTAVDDYCLYVHDPDFDKEEQSPLDSQHVPIALEDFDRMSSYGSDKLRAVVMLRKMNALNSGRDQVYV